MPMTAIKYSVPHNAPIKAHMDALRWAQSIVPIGQKIILLAPNHIHSANLARTLYHLKSEGELGFTLGIPEGEQEAASRLLRHAEQSTIPTNDLNIKTYIYIFDRVEDIMTIPPLQGAWNVIIFIKQEGIISLKDVNTILTSLVSKQIAVYHIETSLDAGFDSSEYMIILMPVQVQL